MIFAYEYNYAKIIPAFSLHCKPNYYRKLGFGRCYSVLMRKEYFPEINFQIPGIRKI